MPTLLELLAIVGAIVGIPLAVAAYVSIIRYLPLLKKAEPIMDAVLENPNLLSGDTSAISATLGGVMDEAMVKVEQSIPPMINNAVVDMVENGTFDIVFERFGPEIVKMGQTIGQNIATVTFSKLKEQVTGQAGGVQKGVNAQERQMADLQFDQLIGMEGGADMIDEFAAEFGIPVGIARQYAPMVMAFVKQKFGHIIPQLQGGGQAAVPQTALPPSNGPRSSSGFP